MTVTAPAPSAGQTKSGSPGVVEGLAVAYDTPTRILTPFGSFDEVIAPGALTSALRQSDVGTVALLRDHDPSLLLARKGARSLALMDDSVGLRFAATLPETPLGHETATLVARRDLNGMSFAFLTAKDGVSWRESVGGGLPLRVVERVERLLDVSIVTYPAYESTTVVLRGVPPRAPRESLLRRRHALTAARYDLRPSTPRYGRSRPAPSRLEAWCRARPYRVDAMPAATR